MPLNIFCFIKTNMAEKVRSVDDLINASGTNIGFNLLKYLVDGIVGNKYNDNVKKEFCSVILSECSDVEIVLERAKDEDVAKTMEEFAKEYEKNGLPKPEYVWRILKKFGDPLYQSIV